MTADANIVIGVTAKDNGAKRIKRDLDDISKSGDKANKSVVTLTNALKGIGAGLVIRGLIGLADGFTELENRLKVVTDSTKGFNDAFEEIQKISRTTQSSLKATTDVFARFTLATKELGLTQSDNLKLTQSLQQSFRLSGATMAEAANSAVQLAQGLSAGALRGDEFRSVSEQNVVFMNLLGAQLGKTRGELREMANDGKLTADIVAGVLLDSFDDLNKQAEKIAPTIGSAFVQVGNSLQTLVGKFSQATGAGDGFAKALNFLADNLENVSKFMIIMVSATLPALIRSFALALPAAIATTTKAIKAMTLAMASNPIGAISVAISVAITSFILFRKEILETLDKVHIFGTTAGDVLRDIGHGAKIIFSTIYQVVAGTFEGLSNIVRRSISQAEILLFKFTDRVSQTTIGKRLGIEVYTPSLGAIRRANQSISEAFEDGFDGRAEDLSRVIYGDLGTGRADVETEAEKAVKGINSELDKSSDKIKEVEKKVTVTERAFEKLGDGISRAFGDAFSDGKDGFKTFIDGAKDSFRSFISELGTMIAKPLLLKVVAGVTGGAFGSAAGTANASGLGSIISSVTGGSGGGFSLGGINSGISKLLSSNFDKIGNVFGVNGLSNFSSLTNGSFGGSLGGAAGGFLGNFGANALLGGNRGIGANIGGTLGGIAGSFIPVPILGPAIGSFIGNAIGGLFGGGSIPSDAAESRIALVDGKLSVTRTSSDEASPERLKQINKGTTAIIDAVNNVVAAVGGNIERIAPIKVGATRREAGIAKADASGERVFSSFQKAVDFALTASLSNAELGGVSDQFAEIFKKIFAKGGKFDDRAKEVLEAKAIIDLIEGVEEKAVSPLKMALEALDEQFDQMRKTATELGLPLDKVNEALQKQKDALIQSSLKPLQDFLDAQALSSTSSLSPVERLALARSEFDNNLSAIKSGDFSDLNSITGQASTLLNIGREVFASGEGFSSLEAFTRQSIAGIAGDLGAPNALDDSISREIVISNAEQNGWLEQIVLELTQLREENIKLRKAQERIGNALVIQT